MKKFLAIYTGTPASMSKWDALPEQEKNTTVQEVPEWSYQDLVDTRIALTMRHFEFIWTDSAKIAVPTNRIVEAIYVLGKVQRGGFSISVDMFLDALFLQATEEGFRHSIVPAISSPAHARFKMIRLAVTPPGITSVLSSLI